jgi:uncharacterized protein (DUF39 family)
MLNKDMAYFTGLSDKDIFCQVVDYGSDYPSNSGRTLGEVSYAELKSGRIEFMGKTIETAPLSSYPMDRKIAQLLREWILRGYTLGVPQTTPSTVPYERQHETG